jgi:hypothetical protein
MPGHAGTELEPMSTTTSIKTAVEYSLSSESLIFMIVTRSLNTALIEP